MTDLAFPLMVFQDSLPNVNAAKNQCVPIAHANALQYLEERYHNPPLAWVLLDLHIPGIGRVNDDATAWDPVPENSLVAQIDALTRRPQVEDANTGSGTHRCQQIHGVFGYLAARGATAPVVIRHQGGAGTYGAGATCDDEPTISLGEITSSNEGQHPTWQWIFDQLQAGRSVVMSFGRYDPAGERTSGHMVRVWGAALYNGKRYLYTLDDSQQGDNATGVPNNRSWEVEDIGQPGLGGVPDGRLNMNGLAWEIEFALSMEAVPRFVLP